MRKELNDKEVCELECLQDKLFKLSLKISENDVELHFGNGLVSEQIDIATAALETILQEC